MKKWLTLVAVASVLSAATALPAQADTSVYNAASDRAMINSDLTELLAGSTATLRLVRAGSTAVQPKLTVTTSLGTLNGTGSSVDLTPGADGSYDNLALTSTAAGTALVNVYEDGQLIGSTQVVFDPGPLRHITVQASPNSQTTGGNVTISITATDQYGNLVADQEAGTSFLITTTSGQLTAFSGRDLENGGPTTSFASTCYLSTRSGSAQATLTAQTVGTATVTVTDRTLPPNVTLNGQLNQSAVSLPISFTYPQAVTPTLHQDFSDLWDLSPTAKSSVRELSLLGVLQGYPDGTFHPRAEMKRSEFASLLAHYMGMGQLASTLNGTPSAFADVATSAWYDGAVQASYTLGYIKGDGHNFYPERTISYAEVAQILLSNLGITSQGTWPSGPVLTATQSGLFTGVSTAFAPTDPATRSDIAILVTNALHTHPTGSSSNGSSLALFGPDKSLLEQTLGFQVIGDGPTALVTGVPGNGVAAGNSLQVTIGSEQKLLHLSSNVTLSGAAQINDLLGKKVRCLINPLGQISYMEVVS